MASDAPPPLLESGRLRRADGAEVAYELSGTRDGVPRCTCTEARAAV